MLVKCHPVNLAIDWGALKYRYYKTRRGKGFMSCDENDNVDKNFYTEISRIEYGIRVGKLRLGIWWGVKTGKYVQFGVSSLPEKNAVQSRFMKAIGKDRK